MNRLRPRRAIAGETGRHGPAAETRVSPS
jgi:hypothetical protein